MKRDTVETSLLSVFRLFIGFRLVFFLLSWLAQRFAPFPRFQPVPVFPYFGLTETIFLLLFLSLPWLQKELGKFYLPIALGIATIAPFVENFLTFNINRFDEVIQIGLLNGQWQLFIFLLVPLILVSWQYSFRTVIAYCIALILFDALSIGLLQLTNGGIAYRTISLTLFRTLTFLLVGYIIGKLVTEQRQQNNQLNQANRQLTSYTNTLEQLAISRERNRLAREFHDTLAHTLSAVAVQLEAVNALWDTDKVKSRAMLAQSLAETRQGLTETRRAIQSLRATPIEDLGLNLAIRNLAHSLSERYNMIFEVNVPEDLPELKPEAEHAVYRIVEEALRNTVQHAKAKKVLISINKEDSGINLIIRDNGQGFNITDNMNSSENHFGLRGMHEYAESIQADLKIDSQKGQGTTVTLSLEVVDGTRFNM